MLSSTFQYCTKFLRMDTCVSYFLSLWSLSIVSLSSLGAGQTEAGVLDASSEGAEPSPSTSALSETDRDVGNAAELPGLGARR